MSCLGRGEGEGGGGELGRGSTVALQPPALCCQMHSCFTKWFFAVKFQGKDVTAEDLSQSTMLFFIAKRSRLAGVFPSPPPPPPPLHSLSMQIVIWLCLAVFLGLCVSGATDWGKNSFSVYEKNPPHTREHFTPPDTVHSSPPWFELTTNRSPNKPHAVNREIWALCHMDTVRAPVIQVQTYCSLWVEAEDKRSCNNRDSK